MIPISIRPRKPGTRSPVKPWLFLKLMTLCILFFNFQVIAGAPRINISKSNIALIDAFKEIEEQSGYLFFYDKELVQKRGVIVLRLKKDATLEEALTACLKDQRLSYSIVNNTVVIYPSHNGSYALAEDPHFRQQDTLVNGRVVNTAGEPIEGISVKVKNTSIQASTSSDGRFTIRLPNADAVLEFSSIGYITQEVTMELNTPLNITLEAANTAISEVVVIGYGTSSAANLTGSVSTVDVDKVMTSRPATNVASLLEGQVSGVFIHQNSGQPGAEGMNMLIRGQGSMGDSQPLVIIDGMESSMDNINPFDIENISILKDAASASIYGTRAANGVILITTKRGRSGPTQISYNSYFARQTPTAVPDFLGSADYARLHNEARMNAGLSPTFSDDVIARYAAGNDPDYPSTDWMGVLYSGSGASHFHNLDISGGTESSRFSISMAYNQQKGVIKSVDADQANFRMNFDNKITNWLNLGLNTAFSYAVNTIPLTGPELTRGGDLQQFYNSVMHIPPTQKLKLEDGSWSGEYPLGNLAAWIDHGNLRKTRANNLIGTLFSDAHILDGLSWRSRASVDYTLSEITNHIAQFTYGGGQVSGPSSNQENLNRASVIDLESMLSYDKRFGQHGIKGLLGTSSRSEFFNSTMAFRIGFPSNDVTAIDAGSTDGLRNGGMNRKATLGSYFTRINYDYNNKYLFEANLRRDGSSKFARGNRWGWFPSFSAGWVLSDERFLEDVTWLNFFKLRASWGQLGNHRIADFLYMPLISLGQNYTFGGSVAVGAAQTAANNPDITWETTTEKNIGLDLRLFNSAVSLTMDAYDRYTDDILTVVPVSAMFGLPAPTVNGGAMRNRGFETEIGYANMKGAFQYNFSLNASYNKNNVEKYHGRDIFEVNAEGGAIVRETGIPWNSFIGYEWIGHFQSDTEAQNGAVHHPSVGAGDLKFKDQNGDGRIDANDRVILGNPTPTFTYGMNLGFRYKGVDFSTFLHGVADVQRYLRVRGYMPFLRNGKALSMHLDRNVVENGVVIQQGHFPKTLLEGGEGGKNVVSSNFTIHDASYLRLKNIQLGYTIPTSWTESISVSRIRIYLSGENLLTFTKFPEGFDPEANTTSFHGHVFGGASGWSYPQVKFYTAGLNVTF